MFPYIYPQLQSHQYYYAACLILGYLGHYIPFTGNFLHYLDLLEKILGFFFTSNGIVGRLIMCFNHYYPELVHTYTVVPIYVLGTFLWGGIFFVVARKIDKVLLRFR